jgi:acyl carrier protein
MLDEVETVVQAVATELKITTNRARSAKSLRNDLGMDSIAAANVLFALEEIYGVELHLESADRVDSVSEIAAVVRRSVERRSGTDSARRSG